MSDATIAAGAPATPPKEDPETFVLRGSPRQVVRIRRGLIIGTTALVAASLVAVTWIALEPPSFRIAAEEGRAGEPVARSTPDSLAGAPDNYGEVPRLGPPLPGDLGRPIVAHQRAIAAQQGGAASPAVEPNPARAADEAARQRRAAEQEAARRSDVLVQLSRVEHRQQVSQPVPQFAAEPPGVPRLTGSDGAVPGERSMAGAALTQIADTSPQTLRPLPSPWTLSAGTVIPASLITGLNSDLPGTMLAQVTENVRDSATGRTILIPQGARLIGSYDSVVAFGQRRAMIIWRRIVLPDGSSIALEDLPASDVAGYAGLEDRVDAHSWRLLKSIALSTLLGVGTELSLGSGESDLVRAMREAAQQNAARAGDQITSRNLDVEPTITVRPGWPLRVIVHSDLVLRPWGA